MAASRRRRVDAEIIFQGSPVSHDVLIQLWNSGTQGDGASRHYSRYRINVARGIRLKTSVVNLRPSWVRRHPEAAEWVVKVLPERRTLERDLIASVAAVEPTYSRKAIGFLDRDKDNAAECANFMEEWRKEYVPYQTFAEKGAEDGEYGVVVIPTDVDMEGCPDFYDRLDEAAYDALDDEERAEYTPDEDDPKGRYSRKHEDGRKKTNPAFDKGDDEKSREAHQKAVQRYLLKQEQGACTVRVIPANDCIPFLTRGTKRDRWKLFALVERTLYYPEELLTRGYGWRGMGDRALIPKGFDPLRSVGQNGMYYMYTLYMVWVDPKDPKKIERPLICYSVGGQPTWMGDEPEDRKMPESGVAVLDLYESHGLEGPFWWYGGGLHTSDDDPDFYWEPYLWPLVESFATIEGLQTMVNAATAVNATTGYFHRPDPALLALDDEGLVEADTGELRKPVMPDAGEIETVIGEVFPATPAMVSPDIWKVIQNEYVSLRENTTLEQAGAGAQPSGHAMVVKETIAQTAKRHIREGACDAVKFCGERAMRIFTARAKESDVMWPIQTTRERPVGSEVREAGAVLEWDPEWIGDGEYKLTTDYPDEYNPVKVETAMSGADRGYNSPEDVWEAQGITDPDTQWAKILKWQIRKDPAYIQAQVTRLAKRQGNKLMLQILKLQNDQKMTKSGPPGFEPGIPSAVLNGPGGGGGVSGGPTAAQRSLGGQMSAATAPGLNDAAAQAQIPGAA